MEKVGIGRCLNKSSSEVRRHRHLLCLPALVRGGNLGSDGESFSRLRCGRASAALVCPLAGLFSSSSGTMVVLEFKNQLLEQHIGDLYWFAEINGHEWAFQAGETARRLFNLFCEAL